MYLASNLMKYVKSQYKASYVVANKWQVTAERI